MPSASQGILTQLLVPSILLFFLIGGIFSAAAGLGLIVSGARTLRFFDQMNRWVSWRRTTKQMAVSRDLWPWLQRYRIAFAVIIVVASAYSAFNLIARDLTAVLANLIGAGLNVPNAFAAWIVSGLRWFLILGSVLGIVVGVMLGLFPKALIALEQTSSRWYSSRGASKAADTMHFTLDKWVGDNPRITGWVILILALVEVIDIAALLF